jgi:hypothetical protein
MTSASGNRTNVHIDDYLCLFIFGSGHNGSVLFVVMMVSAFTLVAGVVIVITVGESSSPASEDIAFTHALWLLAPR